MKEIPENLFQNQRIKLLDGFSVQDRIEFLSFGKVVEFNLHDKIILEYEDDSYIYLIMNGEVSIWKKDVPVFALKAGDVFNEIKIFLPKPNNITVIAEDKTTVIKFKRNEILNYFHLKPERLFKIFTLNIISILFKKIEGYEESLINVFNINYR